MYDVARQQGKSLCHGPAGGGLVGLYIHQGRPAKSQANMFDRACGKMTFFNEKLPEAARCWGLCRICKCSSCSDWMHTVHHDIFQNTDPRQEGTLRDAWHLEQEF